MESLCHFLYGECAIWILKSIFPPNSIKKVNMQLHVSFEFRCNRRIVNIKWFHRMRKAEIGDRVKMRETTIPSINQSKLSLLGHIWQMDNSKMVTLASSVSWMAAIDETGQRFNESTSFVGVTGRA